MELAKSDLATRQFMKWVEYFSPGLYAQVIKNDTTGLGFSWGDIFDKTVDIGKQYLEYDQQKELLELQAQRAAAGLPPLQTGTATQIVTMQPSPEQLQTQQLTNQLLKFLPWMLGGILAFKFLDM